MSTDTDRRQSAPTDPSSGRPPLLAMVVVGLVIAASMGALFLGARSATDTMLDEGESAQDAGPMVAELGGVTVEGQLDTDWIRRERCADWIQLNSMSGDATTLHLIATDRAPDPATSSFVPVDDLPGWWGDTIDVRVDEPVQTELLGTPAVAGQLMAGPGANEEALLVACPATDGSPGVGIRGPAAGFEQYVVATTEPVPGIGPVVVLGAAWVGGDLDLATAEAERLATSLHVVSD